MSDQPPVRRPTPDEVLHALRHFAQFNSDEPFMWPAVEPIVATTTVKAFERLRDTDGDLAFVLSDFFGLADTDNELKAALAESRLKTVGELCEFLAPRVTLTPLAEFGFLDRRCEAGSIFVTLKAALAANGLNVRDLAPSTPIARYARDYCTYCTLIKTAARIAPTRLPLSEPNTTGCLFASNRLVGCGLFLAGIVILGAGIGDVPGGALAGVTIALLMAFFVVTFALGFVNGFNRIPGARTFRDLCKVLAGEAAERPARTKGSVP